MKPIQVPAFLSCSFATADESLNSIINEICLALEIQCKNVSGGFSKPPCAVAKDLIEESKIVIAVAVKREEGKNGLFFAPQSVRDEIAIAFTMARPCLILVETGVSTDGFMKGYGTYLSFQRDDLLTRGNLGKLISSIHQLKLSAINSRELVTEADTSDYILEELAIQIELKHVSKNPNRFSWMYATTRKFEFTGPLECPIRNAAWAILPVAPTSPDEKIVAEIEVKDSNRQFHLINEIEQADAQRYESSIFFKPQPIKGDRLTLFTSYESPNLNQIYHPKEDDLKLCTFEGIQFHNVDGIIPISITRRLHARFVFPAAYGLTTNDVHVVVASHSSGLDHLIKSEMKRLRVKFSDFGGGLSVDIEVESPLIRHLYGLSWRVPKNHRL